MAVFFETSVVLALLGECYIPFDLITHLDLCLIFLT